ncbi:hypothetical protein BGC_17440 [Burkholderia sp. 3C]
MPTPRQAVRSAGDGQCAPGAQLSIDWNRDAARSTPSARAGRAASDSAKVAANAAKTAAARPRRSAGPAGPAAKRRDTAGAGRARRVAPEKRGRHE